MRVSTCVQQVLTLPNLRALPWSLCNAFWFFGARVRYTRNLLQLDCLYLPHFSAPDMDQAVTLAEKVNAQKFERNLKFCKLLGK